MKNDKKLSIIIPCYNEKEYIEILIDKILKSPIKNKEIIVVDDCSNDGTKEILKKIEPLVDKVIFNKKNVGKGGALRIGFKLATGDVIIIQDADLEYNPDEYAKIVYPIFEGKCSVVYGSRFLNKKYKGALFNRIANYCLTKFSNFCNKQKLTDVHTCYIAFSSKLLNKIVLYENDYAFNPEITGKFSSIGIKIYEVPISYNPRTKKMGKKIKFIDGIKALKATWKYRKKYNKL